MEYVYPQGIGSSYLRLLEPTIISNSLLSFSLVIVPRAAAPAYTAVSYTWGDGPPSETISLNGQDFRVRLNLWSCLYHLSPFKSLGNWNYLWVDAICINQEDLQERNDQVRYMDKTYRDAACVSVWLGLSPVPDEYKPLLSRVPAVKTFHSEFLDWSDHMDELANRPYWSRFWVIQEFLLGKDVQIHCADSQINWLDFQDMLCRKAGFNQFAQAAIPEQVAALFRALPLTIGRHPDKHPELMQPLGDLLINHCRSVCKDPRDRVFALLGLIPKDDQRLLSRFFPDYTISEDAVRIITLAHLTQYEALLVNSELRITPDSTDIFLGLGVISASERTLLLNMASKIDYLGDWEPGQLPRMISDAEMPDQLEFPTSPMRISVLQGLCDELIRTQVEREAWVEQTWADEALLYQTASSEKSWVKVFKWGFIFILVCGAIYYFIGRGNMMAHSRAMFRRLLQLIRGLWES